MITSPSTQSDFDKYDEPRLHMERLLKAHLIEFDLPIRILIKLESVGIRTLGDLVKRSEADLMAIPQFGQISLDKIKRFLDYHMLSLK